MTAPEIDIERICYQCVGDLDEPGIVCPRCGWDNRLREDKERYEALPAMTLKNGRFFIGKPLGQGGFAITYIGRDLLAGEFEDARRAIKEYFPKGAVLRKRDGITVTPSDAKLVETFEKQKQRTHREGQRIASVSANVLNVVRAYDCFHENGTTYTVMEYIDGGTLSDIVDKNGPFGWPQAYERLKPVMEALEKMHVEHRIYHLDISPDNIMFRRRANGSYGEPVLVDFGASVEAEPSGETKSMSSMVVKNGFAPPEQYIIGYSEMTEDANGTALMDEYAMCATLYFAITGETPVASITRLGGEDNLKPLSDFDRNIPDCIENAIAKGMSIQAQDRYTSMKALIRALENPPEHNPPEHTDTPEPPWRKIVAIAAVGAILAVVVGVILVINRTQGDRAQTIALNAEGQFTWTKSSGVEAGALVGKAGEQEIRYELRDSEVVTLNGAMIDNYAWSLEETRTDGGKRTVAIQKAGDRG